MLPNCCAMLIVQVPTDSYYPAAEAMNMSGDHTRMADTANAKNSTRIGALSFQSTEVSARFEKHSISCLLPSTMATKWHDSWNTEDVCQFSDAGKKCLLSAHPFRWMN
jgi:hypothetical protein